MKSRAGALWRKLDVTERWSPIPGKYGGVGQGIPFLSQCCDTAISSKSRLDQRAGRIREQSTSVNMHDICMMERTALDVLIPQFERCITALEAASSHQEASGGAVLDFDGASKVLAAAALMARKTAYVACSMFVITATRQMGGRGEPSVTSFQELYPTAHGVQLQPLITKRRQCVLPSANLACAHLTAVNTC